MWFASQHLHEHAQNTSWIQKKTRILKAHLIYGWGFRRFSRWSHSRWSTRTRTLVLRSCRSTSHATTLTISTRTASGQCRAPTTRHHSNCIYPDGIRSLSFFIFLKLMVIINDDKTRRYVYIRTLRACLACSGPHTLLYATGTRTQAFWHISPSQAPTY